MKKIMFVGYSRAGKDEAGNYLEKVTTLKFAGTTSLYLCKYVAAKLGKPEAEVYATRHRNREEWYRIGNELRENDPGILIRESLEHGDIIGGVRDYCEVVLARDQGLVDIIVWVENKTVPVDPTVRFTEKECDIIIPNNWSLAEYHERLQRFAKFAGLPLR